MHYYQHNIADYRKDTAHLSLLEHGIYRQLLDTYYLTEKPIPLDDAVAMRTHSIRTADEVQAYKNVLSDFFFETDDGYIHKRCDSVIASYHAKSDQSRKAANARWAGVSEDSNADAMRTHTGRNADAMPTINHKPLTNSKDNDHFFDAFWKDYPNKVNKVKARKSWLKLTEKEKGLAHDKLKAFIANLPDFQRGDNFNLHASTYLNQKRWTDLDEKSQHQPSEYMKGMK